MATLQANKQSRTWDKFHMPTLQGKTMGLLGFGDIAKHTARAAKAAFGMRIVTVRRNAAKSQSQQDAELVDSTLDLSSQKLELFAQSDFVVCVLPGTLPPPCPNIAHKREREVTMFWDATGYYLYSTQRGS